MIPPSAVHLPSYWFFKIFLKISLLRSNLHNQQIHHLKCTIQQVKLCSCHQEADSEHCRHPAPITPTCSLAQPHTTTTDAISFSTPCRYYFIYMGPHSVLWVWCPSWPSPKFLRAIRGVAGIAVAFLFFFFFLIRVKDHRLSSPGVGGGMYRGILAVTLGGWVLLASCG